MSGGGSGCGNLVVDSPLIVDVVNNTTVDCPSSLVVSLQHRLISLISFSISKSVFWYYNCSLFLFSMIKLWIYKKELSLSKYFLIFLQGNKDDDLLMKDVCKSDDSSSRGVFNILNDYETRFVILKEGILKLKQYYDMVCHSFIHYPFNQLSIQSFIHTSFQSINQSINQSIVQSIVHSIIYFIYSFICSSIFILFIFSSR